MANIFIDNIFEFQQYDISIDKDNPHLFEDELNIKEDDFKKVQEFIRKHYNYFQKYFDNEIDIGELRKRVYEA